MKMKVFYIQAWILIFLSIKQSIESEITSEDVDDNDAVIIEGAQLIYTDLNKNVLINHHENISALEYLKKVLRCLKNNPQEWHCV